MNTPNLPRGPCWVEQHAADQFTTHCLSFEGENLNFANFFEEKPTCPTFQIDVQDWKEFAPRDWNPDFLIIYSFQDQAHIVAFTDAGRKLKQLLLLL